MSIFVKFGSIKGSATAGKNKDWCAARNVSFGTQRAVKATVGSTKNRETSAAVLGEVSITREYDEASPRFWLESLIGKGEKCEIHVTRSEDELEKFIELTLHEAIITSYEVAIEGASPVENLTISYVKMETRYIPRTSDNKSGSPISAGYDSETAKKM